MTTLRNAVAYAIALSTTSFAATSSASAEDAAVATAAPTFSPVAGGYSAPQTITISDKTKDVEIYYTTNGTTPTTASTKYRKPIALPGTATIEAIAVAKRTSKESPVATASYVVDSGSTPIPTGNVYSNGAFSTGVGFFPFGGSTNVPPPAIDPSTLFTDGTPALKVVVTGAAGSYSGGAWVASAVRNVTGANALTFWAKASQNQSTLKVQLGNDGSAGANVNYQVESIGIPLTTSWQQFFIPLPDPSKATGLDGLASFADANNNYSFWLADVEYAVVSNAVIGTPAQVSSGWPSATIAPGAGNAYAINPAPNSIIWTGAVPTLPNGQNLDNVAWRWYTLTSDNPSVATVSIDGVVTGVAPGTAHISATVAGKTVPGQATITVAPPLTVPTTYAPTPTYPASSVTALFDSSGVYVPHPVDTFDAPWSSAVFTDPYAIAGGSGVIQYVLNAYVGLLFGDGELNGTVNTVNASAYSALHVSIWTPNPSDLQIQLVDNAAGPGTEYIGVYDAGILQANSWQSLDIPLASFSGLGAVNELQQMLFIAGNSGTVIYVDNLYFH